MTIETPLFVVEAPHQLPARVWVAHSLSDFYNCVEKANRGSGETIYYKTTARHEYNGYGDPDEETLEEFMEHLGLAGVDPDATIWQADCLAGSGSCRYQTVDPGEFEAYKEACFHDLNFGRVLEGVEAAQEYLAELDVPHHFEHQQERIVRLLRKELAPYLTD